MYLELLLAVVTVTCIYVWMRNQRLQNFPPGPQPLPIFGNLLTIGKAVPESFYELSKKYGPIVGVKLGPYPTVCLHGTELIKEAFCNSAFADRNVLEAVAYVSGGQQSITWSSGKIWAEQRRFALRQLKDLGFGKRSMEQLIMHEVNDFSKWLKTKNGVPVDLQERLALAVGNSLWAIVTGERYDQGDPKLQKIFDDIKSGGNLLFDFDSWKGLLLFFYPKVGKMFPNWSGWNELKELANEKLTLLDTIIEHHQKTLQNNSPRDFVDAYLAETERIKDKNSSFHPNAGGVHPLRCVMADFFLAGADTTPIAMTWLFLYLLHNPEVERKMFKELSWVAGSSRTVTFSNRNSLPYTEAVIMESLRLGSLAPLALPHAAVEDTVFHGYNIPKGTVIFANVWANHIDPAIWGEDAKEFRPERFLNADGTSVVKSEALMPFSIGKRICPAETMARDTLFLFAANLVLNFELVRTVGQPLPPLEYKKGQLTFAPVSSTVVMKVRQM